MFGPVSFVAVIAAALVKIVLGMFWYSDNGFGKKWKQLSQVKPDKEKLPVAFVGMTINSVIAAFIFATFAVHMHVTDIATGFMMGLKLWFGFVMPFAMSGYFWENKQLELVFINSGYELVALVAMGVVIGLL